MVEFWVVKTPEGDYIGGKARHGVRPTPALYTSEKVARSAMLKRCHGYLNHPGQIAFLESLIYRRVRVEEVD